jgi:hypothetical protein
MRRVLCLTLALSGCASPENREALEMYRAGCASGDRGSCMMVPVQQDANEREASDNAVKVAIGLMLLPLVILAASKGHVHGGRFGHLARFR